MDITTLNFKELLPEIKEVINSASFICLDGEFTGLNNGDNIASFATPAEYYSKLRTGALDFLFIQFGLSAFIKEKCGRRYSNKTYNFYLFPRQYNRHARDRRFLCQASSLTFLTEHGFDFNKLFKEGIPYMTQEDEDNLREVMAERQKWKENNASASQNNKIPVPAKLQSAVNEAVKVIKKFLLPESKKDEVKIEKCSSFVRKLVYQAMDEEIKSSNLSLETQNGVLIARKGISKENLEKEKKEKLAKEENEIDDAVGFSKIVKELSKSGKLLVGHNMLLDICHIIHTFLNPLPKEYNEFKEMVHDLFPNLIDTKYMCSIQPLSELVSSSVLEHFLNTVQKTPFKLPEMTGDEEKYTFNLNKSNQLHNAGYDAYITGICFLSSLHYLEESEANDEQQPLTSPVLKKYLNKLFLMRTPDTYIDLAGSDPEPPRDHVFHITFPKDWTSHQITELFSPFGSVQVWWQSDTTAWVGLHDRNESKRASKVLERENSKLPQGVVVIGYARYSLNTASSSRPNKRKTAVLSCQEECDVENDLSKKRKSTTMDFSNKGTPEKDENCKDLEFSGTESKNSSTNVFPVNQDWE